MTDLFSDYSMTVDGKAQTAVARIDAINPMTQ